MDLVDIETKLLEVRAQIRKRAKEDQAYSPAKEVVENLLKTEDRLQEAQESLQKARLLQEELMGGFE